MKNRVNSGLTIEYTNGGGSTIAAGTPVVVGNIIGVPVADIPVGETGVLHTEGVFHSMPKVSVAVFAKGEKLIFDVSANAGAGAFDDSSAVPASGDVTGAAIAWEAGADGETTCTVRLTPGNTTVTS